MAVAPLVLGLGIDYAIHLQRAYAAIRKDHEDPAELEGDPIETSQGDGVRITWTWLDATGGEESVEAKFELVLQEGDS